MKNNARIMDVDAESIAWKAGLESGDMVVSINHKPLKDIFDYHYSMSNSKILIKIKKSNGGYERIKIFKEEYEDIGLIFRDDLITGEKTCINKCIFCFIDQLPPGMRDSLYHKDDDARLSLLHGNYVTLTNTGMDELKRLARLRLSPINISVHTVNPELRIIMMGNRFAGDIMDKINFLAKKRITMNCQIVLCRGYNDGDELVRTIKELGKIQPQINSLSVVPVGITKYRQHLCDLEPYDRKSSEEIINIIEGFQPDFKAGHGNNFVYAADEFYIMAGHKMPGGDSYDGYPQLENGVGLITSFEDEVKKAIEINLLNIKKKRRISIVTGAAAYKFIKKIAVMTENKIENVKIKVHKANNNFFGDKVTVAGLITGNDIINALRGKDLGDELLIPRVMLKADEDVFLDNATPGDIAEMLGVKVTPVYISGYDYIDKVVGRTMDV